jgi:hypothetical protein
MKIKIRTENASAHTDEWPGMDEWLAELREDDRDEPPGDHVVTAADTGLARSSDLALAPAQAEVRALAEAYALVEARVLAEGRVEPRADAAAGGRAVIGDELRIPIMWCDMGSCIAWYTDPAALGEADTRARAIAAGWRIDALGRLACPTCQQTDPCFWTACPVVPWDRYVAMVRAARTVGLSQRG